jgi:tetratricopeptide (TPR) repeat protein
VIAICAWVALIAGLGFGLLPRDRVPTAALVSGSLLAGLAVLSGLSVIWASDDGAALEEAVRASGYLGIFALVVGASRGREARPWLAGLAIGILVVGLLALVSRLIPGLPGGDEEIARLLPAARGRLSYPIGYWNALAVICALGIVLLTWFGVTGRSRATRVLSVAAIPLLGLDIYLTSSRGGVAVLAVGVISLVAIGPRRSALLAGLALGGIGAALAILLARGEPALLEGLTNADARTQGAEMVGAIIAVSFAVGAVRLILDGTLERISVPPRVGWVSVAAVVLLFGVGIAISNPAERFHEFKQVPKEEGAGQTNFIASHLASGSGSGRWQYWGEALDAFGSEPVHGIGAGAYKDYWNQHAPISRITGDAHSLYIEQLGELGPLALVLVLGFLFLGPIWSLARGAPAAGPERAAAVALVAGGAVSAAIEWIWEVPAVFGVVVVALGLLAGPALGESAGESQQPAAAGRNRFGWGLATIAFGCIALVLAAAVFLAGRDLNRSQAAASDGDLPEAADKARAAIAIEPWAADPRLQLALVQELAGDLDAAAKSAEEATDRARDNWQLWVVRARIAIEQDDLQAAESDLREARRLNPRGPIFSSLVGPLEGVPAPNP